MISRKSGALWILVHNEDAPSDSEWNSYLDGIRDVDPESSRTLVFTDGGGPNSSQREQINKLLAGRTTRVAVVSDHRVTRGIITAMSWFNEGMRAFRSEQWSMAFTYLHIAESETQQIWDGIRLMQRELGLQTRSSRSPASGLGSDGYRHSGAEPTGRVTLRPTVPPPID